LIASGIPCIIIDGDLVDESNFQRAEQNKDGRIFGDFKVKYFEF